MILKELAPIEIYNSVQEVPSYDNSWGGVEIPKAAIIIKVISSEINICGGYNEKDQ